MEHVYTMNILELKFVTSKFDPNSSRMPSRKPSKTEFYPSFTEA